MGYQRTGQLTVIGQYFQCHIVLRTTSGGGVAYQADDLHLPKDQLNRLDIHRGFSGNPQHEHPSQSAYRLLGLDDGIGIATHGFHRGINPAYDHRDKGLYHFTFIKALTNLTDLGPDDGGTTVIAGTHKVPTDVPQEAIIAAAMDAPSMIHQVEAPAGSTLLFYESLIHAAGIIKSDKDRLLILAGYMPTMFQAWMDYDPDPDFAQTLSDEHRALITGEQKFHWPRNPRDLGVPAATV